MRSGLRLVVMNSNEVHDDDRSFQSQQYPSSLAIGAAVAQYPAPHDRSIPQSPGYRRPPPNHSATRPQFSVSGFIRSSQRFNAFRVIKPFRRRSPHCLSFVIPCSRKTNMPFFPFSILIPIDDLLTALITILGSSFILYLTVMFVLEAPHHCTATSLNTRKPPIQDAMVPFKRPLTGLTIRQLKQPSILNIGR
jgi:hypothetical protein